MRMRAGVGQDVLDHTFGGVTCGLVLLEDDKHFQSSVYIGFSLTIHIDPSHNPHSIEEHALVEEQGSSDVCKYDEVAIL